MPCQQALEDSAPFSDLLDLFQKIAQAIPVAKSAAIKIISVIMALSQPPRAAETAPPIAPMMAHTYVLMFIDIFIPP